MATSWCDMRLPNHYTNAKFEKILPITSKDIHHFVNITVVRE